MITPNKKYEMTIGLDKCRGLTLIELIIALAIIAILVTAGVPGMRQLIDSNRTTAYVNSLVGGIHLARSEAVKRNSEVSICASNNGTGCSGDWSNGWVVLDSVNQPGVPLATNGQTFENLRELSADANQIVFDGDGLPARGVDLDLGVDGINARRLHISPAGSVQSGILE